MSLDEAIMLALDLAPAMTVADVGAGAGNFSMRLARLLPSGQVIATEAAPAMVRHLESRARSEGLANVRVIQATHARSGLAASSVDAILIVNAWHHIAHQAAYARDLATALRSRGRIVVVDYSVTAENGPPLHARVAAETIVADLRAAGLSAQASAFGDQYIVTGQAPG